MNDHETLPARIASGDSLPVRSMNELAVAGELLAQSGMFGIQNAAAGFVVAATCHQQGISLMEFQRTYHIVEGKPSMRADAMLAEFRKRGGRYTIVENTVTRAAAQFEFEGNKIPAEFTIEDAQRTGDCFKSDGKTIKHTWAKRPEDMLWARMVSRAVRRLCPEIVAGLYTPEEVCDFDDRPARREPVEIAPEVAAVRAGGIVDQIDYTICPIGGAEWKGRSWNEFQTELLEAALGSADPAMTHTHKAAIRVVLEERKTKGSES
jgi:hypothetical protein